MQREGKGKGNGEDCELKYAENEMQIFSNPETEYWRQNIVLVQRRRQTEQQTYKRKEHG